MACPQMVSLPQAWTRSRHSVGLPKPSSGVPAGPKGNSLSWEQALPLMGTSHSPCWCPGTGMILQVIFQLPTATTPPGSASFMDYLWPQWHVHWDISSAEQWPPTPSKHAASSWSGNSDVERQGREEKSHLSPSKFLPSLKSPTIAQNPQTLGESLPSLPRTPQMAAKNRQPGSGDQTHMALCTDLL